MRWVTHKGIGALAICAGLLANGCASVLEAAAQNPAALVFLPVAAVAEIATAASKENRKPSNGMVTMSLPNPANAPLANRYWDDPNDWVADCDGPMMCGDHEHFSCAGTPGDCYCDCVGSLVSAHP